MMAMYVVTADPFENLLFDLLQHIDQSAAVLAPKSTAVGRRHGDP